MSERGPRPNRRLYLSLCVFASLLIITRAYARAGGGGGFSSGGSGGGGSGSDAIDFCCCLIDLIFWLSDLPLPVILIILGVVAGLGIALAIFGHYLPDAKAAKTASASSAKLAAKPPSTDQLRAHDPNFDETAFLSRVMAAFHKIQAAWCAQDLRTIRAFISDGVYERFTLQIQEQKAEGYHDHMESISVEDSSIEEVNSTGVFDEVAVRISAKARDWRQSLNDDSKVAGSKDVEPFVEYWTFLRRRGAITDASKPGLIEGNCPNCGASIEMNQSANCASCGALLRSGSYDWVLVEITQESVWRKRSNETHPGVTALAARDPDFDLAALEDRASVIYWRKSTADRLGHIDPLRKVATPQFADRYGLSFKTAPNTPRRFIADSAVGSVDTLGIVSGPNWDYALVDIRWSGTWYRADASGRIQSTGDRRNDSTLYVLARFSTAKTDAARSISSAHCPNCGAPETNSESNACESCGTVLNDGAHGWILHDLCQDNRARAAWLAKLSGSTH